MHILHVVPSIARSYGGPTQSLIGYIQAGREQGINTSIAAPACGEDDRDWFRSQVPDTGLHLFPSFGRGAFVFSPALLLWLVRQGQQYDAVHVHGLFNPISSGASRLCAWKNVPYIIRPFGTLSRYTFDHRRSWLKRVYFHLLDSHNVRVAGGMHFTTATEREEASRHGIDFSGRSYVVPPPWRDGEPSVAADTSDTTSPTVLFLSRHHPVKSIETVIGAWPHVSEAVPDARLVIAGSGDQSYTRRLKRLAGEVSNGRSTISFPGFVKGDEKARLLSEASLFVLPSYHENFGVAALEALSAGLPVVISPEVQLSSFVESHELGRVVEREPEVLAETIVEALHEREFRARCSEEGPVKVQHHFAPEVIGEKLQAMYLGVVANK